MKQIVTAALFCMCFSLALAQGKEILNNQSIIELSEAGMSKKIILSKIESSECKFTTDTKSLIALKKSKVDEEVIDAMVARMSDNDASAGSSEKNASASTASKEKKGPGAKKEEPIEGKATAQSSPVAASKAIAYVKKEGSGIYFFNPSNSSLEPLESTVFSQAKSNNWNKAFTHGFGKSTKVMSVSGDEANVQFKSKTPFFYFYFDPENKSLNAQAPTWFASVTSPNEFLLIKFETKVKNSRAVTTASGNAYENAQGIDDKYKRAFKFKRLEKGVYEVYFEDGFEFGEYGFMYAGANAVNGGSSPKVYDFGLHQ
jgi:hypothetical protein